MNKIDRVYLVHKTYKANLLESQKRDIFEKKIGFSYRPMMNQNNPDNLRKSIADI